MLKAIFFDIDDTLYSTSLFAARARKNSVVAMINAGLQLSQEAALSELEEVISEFSSNYEHHFDKLLLRIPKRYYEGVNPSLIIAAGVVAYHETKFRELKTFPDVLPALKRLSRTELIRGIISSGLEIKQAEKLVRLKLVPLLTSTAIFLSDQIGISKPNPKLYERACSELCLRPSETMYVGDNPSFDIDPPNKIGMVTVLIQHPGNKHTAEKGLTKPHHSISNFKGLLSVLHSHYRIPV